MCNHCPRAQSASGANELGVDLGSQPDWEQNRSSCRRTFRLQHWSIRRDQCRTLFKMTWNTTSKCVLNFNLFQICFKTLPLPDQHASQATSVVWHVTDDRTLVSLLPASGTGDKKLQSIAEALCDVTRTRGVTELRMVDHGITPKMKARG